MSFTVRRTGADDYGKFIKALIAGTPGAGKTRVSATFPNPLIASAEGGLMSIAEKGVPYVEIDSIADLIGVRSIVESDAETREELIGAPVDTVVIDTIDTVQKLLVAERLAETKQDSMKIQDWGWLGNQMTSIITGFRSCDMHVVFTCHIKDKQDAETGRTWFEPDLQGQISNQIPGMVDLALVLRSRSLSRANEETNEIEKTLDRYMLAAPTDQFDWVKDRSGKLPAEFNVDMETEFERLFDTIFGHVDVDASEVLLEADVEDPRGAHPKIHRTAVGHDDVVPEGESKSPAGTELPTEEAACEVCSEVVNEDQADLSQIRWRKVLCVKHMREADNKE